jgi:hypothetical protein
MSDTTNGPELRLIKMLNNARLVRGCEERDDDVGLHIFYGQPGDWFSLDVGEGARTLILQGPGKDDFRDANCIKDVIDWLLAAMEAVEKKPRLEAVPKP